MDQSKIKKRMIKFKSRKRALQTTKKFLTILKWIKLFQQLGINQIQWKITRIKVRCRIMKMMKTKMEMSILRKSPLMKMRSKVLMMMKKARRKEFRMNNKKLILIQMYNNKFR